MGEIIEYLRRALKKLEVPIVTGVEVTPAIILEINPDAVVVATGSRPRQKPVPGEYGPPSVLNVREALAGALDGREKVLFMDENGGHHATATVELLVDQGKKVTMVTSDLFIGIELATIGDLSLTRQRLLQKGVTFITDVVTERIDGIKVTARDLYTNKPIFFEGYDTIVLDVGELPEDQLYRQLKGKVKDLYRVGDCVAPRGIDVAVFEGRRVGGRL
jgi:pyruvate/2-oxoglutarate dehydrogenase complex dihydrolipoamide dehydrogenase (E3) component